MGGGSPLPSKGGGGSEEEQKEKQEDEEDDESNIDALFNQVNVFQSRGGGGGRR